MIFDLRDVLRWFADHPEAIDYVDEANEITQTIRQFKIPAYEVAQENPEVLEDIFDRMNNYGKRLTRAEIFSALYAGKESAKDDTPTLDRIAQNINDDLEFGLIDNDTVLQASSRGVPRTCIGRSAMSSAKRPAPSSSFQTRIATRPTHRARKRSVAPYVSCRPWWAFRTSRSCPISIP